MEGYPGRGRGRERLELLLLLLLLRLVVFSGTASHWTASWKERQVNGRLERRLCHSLLFGSAHRVLLSRPVTVQSTDTPDRVSYPYSHDSNSVVRIPFHSCFVSQGYPGLAWH